MTVITSVICRERESEIFFYGSQKVGQISSNNYCRFEPTVPITSCCVKHWDRIIDMQRH